MSKLIAIFFVLTNIVFGYSTKYFLVHIPDQSESYNRNGFFMIEIDLDRLTVHHKKGDFVLIGSNRLSIEMKSYYKIKYENEKIISAELIQTTPYIYKYDHIIMPNNFKELGSTQSFTYDEKGRLIEYVEGDKKSITTYRDYMIEETLFESGNFKQATRVYYEKKEKHLNNNEEIEKDLKTKSFRVFYGKNKEVESFEIYKHKPASITLKYDKNGKFISKYPTEWEIVKTKDGTQKPKIKKGVFPDLDFHPSKKYPYFPRNEAPASLHTAKTHKQDN